MKSKELNYINKLIFDISKKTLTNVFYNLKPYAIRKVYCSKYEKWVYLSSIPILGYYTFLDWKLDWKLASFLSMSGYVFAKSFLQTLIQNYYLEKYRHISKLFNMNLAVVQVQKDKKSKNIRYTLNSYVTLNEVVSRRALLEQYFNTNVVGITQHKTNKRMLFVDTNKVNSIDNNGSDVDKLLSILRYYNFMPKLLKITETDFYTQVDINMHADINKVMSKTDDIAFKLKKQIDIDIEKDYVFKIKKQKVKCFNFQDYLKDVKPEKGNKLPILVGLRHKDGKPAVADLRKVLHSFINGLTGSGKSCLFNSIIQSLMYFSSRNTSMIMVDFKLIEFRQYKDFKNVAYLTTIEELNKSLDKLTLIMNERYLKFENLKNIEAYNKTTKNKMPYVILCIDECSFISSSKKSKEIWEKLIDFIQRGRACGFIGLFATQCPDHKLIDTSFRRQIDTKVTGRLRKDTDLEIVGIESNVKVKNFKVGEFLFDGIGFCNEKIQGLFIDEDKNKNLVYEELKIKLSDKIDLRKFENESSNKGLNSSYNFSYKDQIEMSSNSVINLTNEFKKVSNNYQEKSKIETENKKVVTEKDSIYMLYVKFLIRHYEGDEATTAPPPSDALTIDRLESDGMTIKRLRNIKERLSRNGIFYKKHIKSTKFIVDLEKLRNLSL